MPRISLVIPAFDKQEYLPPLLDSVHLARRQYARGSNGIEIIVADNASTDGTAELARARGCCVVQVEKRVIAAARNAGAQVATGEILAFVDAESQIHPDTFNAIERTMASNHVVVGATGVRFSRTSPGIAIATLVAITLFHLTGLDGAFIFCRHADWQAVGAYNEDLLWLEDAEFLIALKRLGRARGQSLSACGKGTCDDVRA